MFLMILFEPISFTDNISLMQDLIDIIKKLKLNRKLPV